MQYVLFVKISFAYLFIVMTAYILKMGILLLHQEIFQV